MKKLFYVLCAFLVLAPFSSSVAQSSQSKAAKAITNASSNVNSSASQDRDQDQDRVRDQDRDGDCDGDGILNYLDEDMDESINACKQYENRNRFEHTYNARSENARLHMSIVAKAVEELLRFGDELDDRTIGEQIREIAQQHGQSVEKIAEDEDTLSQRSGVLKFLIGPDYAAIDEINQQMEQIRNQVRELNQIRTQLQNEGDQTELQNQIQILELQLNSFQNSLNSQEEVFSLFGWLAKLFR